MNKQTFILGVIRVIEDHRAPRNVHQKTPSRQLCHPGASRPLRITPIWTVADVTEPIWTVADVTELDQAAAPTAVRARVEVAVRDGFATCHPVQAVRLAAVAARRNCCQPAWPPWRRPQYTRRRYTWRAGPGFPRARSYRIVVRGSACEAASWTSRSGTPASSAAVVNACLSVCGVMVLVIRAAGGLADDPPGARPAQRRAARHAARFPQMDGVAAAAGDVPPFPGRGPSCMLGPRR